MKKINKNTVEIMSYVAKVLHYYEYKEDLIFFLELLETSKTHKALKRGHVQMFGMNIEDALQGNFDWHLQPYAKAYPDALNVFGIGSHYPILVGQSFTFNFTFSDNKWFFDSAYPVKNHSVTSSSHASTGNIIDANATNLSIEILFKISDTNIAHSNAHTSQYRIFHFDLSGEENERVRFAHTFAPYVSFDSNREIYFSKKKLIAIEHSPAIVTIENLTSLDRNSPTLFRVVPYKEEVDINEYYVPGI